MAPHKYDMGVVGNCSFMAYVDLFGGVRWMCLPRFDSYPIFANLLAGDKVGGVFSIAPEDAVPLRQYYKENTNVLCTEIGVPGGEVRITDFAPRFAEHGRRFKPNMLFRRLEKISGTPRIRVRCVPASQEGGISLEIVQGSNHLRYLGMQATTRLTTNLPLSSILEGDEIVLSGTRWLVFSYGPPLEAPLEETGARFLHETKRYWREWVKSTSIHGIFQQQVIRSALVLKMHQFEDTGAIIASGTTSLPESPGSGRNWDYRYCWMRDSYYTIRAFADIGHFDEMERYFRYMEDIVARSESDLAPLFTLTGRSVPDERILDWDGYQGNGPVRLGNAANTQRQFDVYGQMLTAILPLYVDRRLLSHRPEADLGIIHQLLRLMARDFDIPDAGIWEFRHLRQAHTYTYLFHWAGACAAMTIARKYGDQELWASAKQLELRAKERLECSFVPELQRYGQAIGSSVADASTLQLVSMGYLQKFPDRALAHVRSLENELSALGSLFFRYKAKDDFGMPDNTFLITAFWRVEALASVGKVDEALEHLEQLLGYANHLGLFSEDVSLDGGQWGNFPQTYSHVGLMNAVARIATKQDRPFFEEEYL
jgi:GH15 family glucan-1,4-alpha-glucosidase